MKFLLIFCLILFVKESEEIFGSKMKKLKQKAKQMYNKKFGKDKTWHFLGHDAAEFPGANEKFRMINEEKWQDYYDCLTEQKASLGSKKSLIPKAVLTFEGGSVKFECKICLSPKERLNLTSIEWDFAGLDDPGLEPIDFTDNIFLAPEDRALHLYNLAEEQTGQYMCKLGNAVTAPYFLTVANITKDLSEVHTNKAAVGPYAADPETIQEHNLILTTKWGEWSPCNQCNKVGKRHKFGYCVVHIRRSEEEDVSVIKEKRATKNENKNVTETDLELLELFENGIPCRSHILPNSIQNLPQVKSRKNEMMIGFCKVRCQENKIFEVKDKNGKVIEKANNSAGIFSLLQGLPPSEPSVERRLQYERKGTDVELSCPGNLNSDIPILWQIGSKNIVPEVIVQETKGRIYISLTDKIYIKKAKIHDSNLYSCWQKNELAGTIRLVVEKKLKLNFNHHIMLFGMVVILSTFAYIFVKAFFGRKYAKTY